MAVDDHLRLAWHAQRDGRGPLREAMLTLAVAESGPGDGWAQRCRARLLSERPNHILGAHPTLERTLADPRVVGAIRKLKGRYPPGRIGWLRFRAELAAGSYTGEVPPLATILDALVEPPAQADVRRDPAGSIRGPLARSRAEVAVGATPAGPLRAIAAGTNGGSARGARADESDTATVADEATWSFYLAVLVAIAMLLASAESGRNPRAA